MGGVNLIASGGDFQVIGPETGIDFNRTGDQVGMVLTVAVQTFALNNNLTPIHIVASELAIIELGLPGGQRGAVGVNKATAITGDTGWVGDNHLCFAASDLNIAIELARVATVDFVEDNTGLTPRQRWVTVDKTAELGLVDAVAVIEDHAAIIDIKLAVNVARHPAAAWRLDIDLWRAVGAVDNGRLLIIRCTAIGDNRGLRG
ncbi:Uncharacterised protein [Yersinia aleksiciae]|uniref:Uncharacterized protein n=1 Tax=Yersinia aleksiciae TaxID=263819 RepID=A0A0T9UG35_YERAE|nr:Uncharacterised protein [Yersinia aleksiciae]